MRRKYETAAPMVFRIRGEAKLRARLENFVRSEQRRTGYDISIQTVVVKAIRQFLDRQAAGLGGEP